MKVKFLPSGEEHEIEFNETILHLAQRKEIHIQSVCKGIPSCAECRVRIVDGEHHVLPPSSKEVSLIGTAHYVDLSRLSCQLRCFGDVTVDLSEQVEKERRMQQRSKERMRSDGEESRAVLGGVFDDSAELAEQVEEELAQQREKGQRRSSRQSKGKTASLDTKNSFYGSFYEGGDKKKSQKRKKGSRKNSGRRTQSAGQKASGSHPSDSAGGGTSKKSRRRRRPKKKD